MAEWSPREFQATLQAFLERRGWSRNEFAMRVGISQGVVNRWFQTDRTFVRPRPKSLERLAEVMDIPHTDLMRMCGHLAPDSAVRVRDSDLEILIRDLEEGWQAADEARRQIGADTIRAVFSVHPSRRPNRRRSKGSTPSSEEDTTIGMLVMQR